MAALKLAFASDLYYPITEPDQLARMAREMAQFRPEAVVLAGDLAESLADLKRCLKLFCQNLACPIWVLPGDHDFWARPPYDSNRLWRELIPQAVQAAGCHWLEGQAFNLGGTAIAGTVAWYDYSSADPALPEFAPDYAQHKYQHNADALRIDWEWSDPEFANTVAMPFLANLDYLEACSPVRRTVVVTHFPVLAQQLPPADPANTFARAYLGNLTLGQQLLSRRKISHIISGHTRQASKTRLERQGGSAIEVYTLGGNYEKPTWLGLTLDN